MIAPKPSQQANIQQTDEERAADDLYLMLEAYDNRLDLDSGDMETRPGFIQEHQPGRGQRS
jgi:hypothetical protein